MLCTSAEAQPQARVAKIGWLLEVASGIATGLKLLGQELHKLGYTEGKNITFESRYAEGQYDRLPALAAELVRLKVDVIVTPADVEALAAKNITTSNPIVFLQVSDPVTAGLVDSLARPGANLTGFPSVAPVLSGKRLELLRNHSKTLKCRGIVESAKSRLCPTMEGEPTSGKGVGVAAYSMEVSSGDRYDGGSKRPPKRVSARCG